MLECSKRAENIINRKVSIFYNVIETALNFFFQLRKICFLRSIEKKWKKNNIFEKISKWKKVKFFQWKIIWTGLLNKEREGGISTARCASSWTLVPQPRFCDFLIELTLNLWNKKNPIQKFHLSSEIQPSKVEVNVFLDQLWGFFRPKSPKNAWK